MVMITWLADVLRDAGVGVVEYSGWKSRTTGGTFEPRGVMWHHDASAVGPSPNVPQMIAEKGNGTTPPPLSQLWVDTRGVWTVIAAGRANHAGSGPGWGVIPKDNGNRYSIGIETDHTTGEAWYPDQLNSLRLGTTAIMNHMGWDPYAALCAHKEYAPGRKVDPDGLNMSTERDNVANGPLRVEDDLSWQEFLKSAYNPDYGTSASDWLTTTAAKTEWTLESLNQLHAKVDALTGALTDDEAKIVAAIRAQPSAEVNVEALAGAIAPLLARIPDDQINDLVARMTHDVPRETRRLLGEALGNASTNS